MMNRRHKIRAACAWSTSASPGMGSTYIVPRLSKVMYILQLVFKQELDVPDGSRVRLFVPRRVAAAIICFTYVILVAKSA